METETKQARLHEYVALFESVKARVGSDEIAAQLVNEVAKDSRAAMIRGERAGNGSNGNGHADGNGSGSDGDQPATRKQLAYLKRLRVDVPEGCTKAMASALIDEALLEG